MCHTGSDALMEFIAEFGVNSRGSWCESSDSADKYCAEHTFDSRPTQKRKGQLPVTAGTFAFCAFKAC